MNGFRLSRAALLETDYRFSLGLRPVIRNRDNGGYQVRAIRIPDLNDMAIRISVRESEPIGSRGKNLPWHLDWLTECQFCSLVPVICLHGAWCNHRTKHYQAECHNQPLTLIHCILLKFNRASMADWLVLLVNKKSF